MENKFENKDNQITNQGVQNINEQHIHYNNETSEIERNILSEILAFVLNIKISDIKEPNEYKKNLEDITNKIKINFEINQSEIINLIFTRYLKYEPLISEFIQKEIEINPYRIDGLKDLIQTEYCKIQNITNPSLPVENVEVFEQIGKILLPDNCKDNSTYLFNSKNIVMYFFELCDFGKKTEKDIINSQTTLFL